MAVKILIGKNERLVQTGSHGVNAMDPVFAKAVAAFGVDVQKQVKAVVDQAKFVERELLRRNSKVRMGR